MAESFGPIAAYLSAVVAVVSALVLWRIRRKSQLTTGPENPPWLRASPRDLTRLTKVKLVPSYGYGPLATLDHDDVEGLVPDGVDLGEKLNDGLDAWRDSYGEIAPADLDLSKALCKDIQDWDLDFQAFFNETDPSNPRCTREHETAHEAAGRGLALRVQRERTDLTVYVKDGSELREVRLPIPNF